MEVKQLLGLNQSVDVSALTFLRKSHATLGHQSCRINQFLRRRVCVDVMQRWGINHVVLSY